MVQKTINSTEEVMNAWENSIPKSLKDAASLA